MTARELLDDPEFRGLLACWERDRNPPIGLADWLRDRGHDALADAAAWFLARVGLVGPLAVPGVYSQAARDVGPSCHYPGKWSWYAPGGAVNPWGDEMPLAALRRLARNGGWFVNFDSHAEAVAAALDAMAAEGVRGG